MHAAGRIPSPATSTRWIKVSGNESGEGTSDSDDLNQSPRPTAPRTPRGVHLTWLGILAALASWSYVAIWSVNSDSLAGFYPGHYLVWLTALLGLAVAVAWLAHLLLGDATWDRSYALAGLFLIVVQAWDKTERLVNGIGERLGPFWAWSVAGAALVVVVTLTIRLASAFPGVRPTFFVLTAFLVGYHLVSAAFYGVEQLFEGYIPESYLPAAIDESSAPDVLVMVLDGYGRSDLLLDQFEHDNSTFESDLAALGVEVVPYAKSNYSMTALSVAGLLNGEYPTLDRPDDASLNRLHEIHSGDNRLFGSLHEAGYIVDMFDNAWTFTRCLANVDVCHAGGLNELDDAVANRTPLPSILAWLRVNSWVRSSVDQLTEATRVVTSGSDGPRLIYVHALIPHPPFQLTADCRFRALSDPLQFAADTDASRADYGNQIACTNSLVLDLVKSMPADAVIFITGDHGPRWAGQDPTEHPDASDAEVLNRVGIFTAYRFPDRCEPIPSGAPLMSATDRLFACLKIPEDGDPVRSPAQEPRYFSQTLEDGVFSVTDITQRVASLDRVVGK